MAEFELPRVHHRHILLHPHFLFLTHSSHRTPSHMSLQCQNQTVPCYPASPPPFITRIHRLRSYSLLPSTTSPEPSQDQQTSLCLHGATSDAPPSLSLFPWGLRKGRGSSHLLNGSWRFVFLPWRARRVVAALSGYSPGSLLAGVTGRCPLVWHEVAVKARLDLLLSLGFSG